VKAPNDRLAFGRSLGVVDIELSSQVTVRPWPASTLTSVTLVEGLKLETDLDPVAELDELGRALRVVGEHAAALQERSAERIRLLPVTELDGVGSGSGRKVIGKEEVDAVAGPVLPD